MKNLIFTLIFCVVFTCQTASSEKCSESEAVVAETVTDYLDSWKNIYLFFRQFNQCYDGAIAEGVQGAIQNLWTEQWATVPEMIALINKDGVFKKFILERISDESFPRDSFDRFVKHTIHECPDVAGEFCRAVINESKRTNAQPVNKPDRK